MADDVVNTMRASQENLVVLRPQRFAKSGRVMEWIHPLTGAVSRRLELGDVERFQVLDADTLLATGRKTAQLIDLATGNVKTFSIPPLSNQDDDEDTVSRSSVDDGSATDAPSQPPSITTDEQRPRQELFAYADPASIYLTELPSQNRPTALRMMGVRVSPLNSWMQAIDRETGQMRWQIDAREITTATFDSWSSPIMVLVQLENRNAANAAAFLGRPNGWRLKCRGILKSTGKTIFEQALSYKLPTSNIHVSTSVDHVIDFDAFGNKIRFVPESVAEDATLKPN